VRANYLIDDLSRNFKRFVGQGILYTAPHNLGVSGYPRVDNWRQVADYFRSIQEHSSDPDI